MNIDEIKQKLNNLDADTIKNFVLDLYIQYPDLKQQVETLVLFNDPAALAKAIGNRIQSVKRGRKFIDYQASFYFARDLDSITSDIEKGLMESSPKQAFELTDKFLATSPKVLNRCDDSSGDIGGVYRDAVLLWLTTAKNWNSEKVNWLERVYDLFQQNEYGVFDPLLPNSHLLLDKTQLNQLAWRFESELRQAVKNPAEDEPYNWAASHSSIGLSSVAEALKDPELYEKATLIQSPEPNELQLIDVIKMYLKYSQTDQALKWLEKPWSTRFARDRLKLLDEAYQQNGDKQQLIKVRNEYYQLNHCYLSFKNLIILLTEAEKKKALSQAIEYAEKGEDLLVNIVLLIELEQIDRAEKLVLRNIPELSTCFYESLVKIAKQFEEASCWLAAVACYRSLLLDILHKARSKAYSHAARYFKKLALFDEKITEYGALETHSEFVEMLKEKHGRKVSFWNRVI